MSDFLHSLRSGKFKRNDRNNRHQNDSHHKSSQWRGDAEARKGPQHPAYAPGQLSTIISDGVSEIKTILEDIAASQRRLAEAYASIAVADERRADAMEHIVEFLRQRFGGGFEPGRDDRAGSGSELEPDPLAMQDEFSITTGDPDRERLRNDMLDMRNAGMSYDKIAQQLESDGVPTFSGKGQWRGHTISKLCKEFSESGV
ncbi:MAG: hypothetical protein ABIK98_10800 [Pseudomonadota bacterium]